MNAGFRRRFLPVILTNLALEIPGTLMSVMSFLAPSPIICTKLASAFAWSRLPPILLPRNNMATSFTSPSLSSVSRKRIAVTSIDVDRKVPTLKRSMTTSFSENKSANMSKVSSAEAEEGLEGLDLPAHLADWIDRLPTDLLDAIDIIEGQGEGCCWIVGGSVRDSLCGLQPWEIDMASTLHPNRLLELFPRALDTGSQYGTVTIRH